jgi:hypothetical protein
VQLEAQAQKGWKYASGRTQGSAWYSDPRECSQFGYTIADLLPFDLAKKRSSPRATLKTKQPLQREAYKALAQALGDRSTALGLSVRALSARLHAPTTRVHKTLRCQRRLDPLEFLDWCDALEIEDPVQFLRDLSVDR